jgi:hypothetical protein
MNAWLLQWIPRDSGSWGVILGVLALLLMFPMGVVINLVTPVIKDWWARRSHTSLVARMKKVSAELDAMQSRSLMTDNEDLLMATIHLGIFCVLGGVGMLTACANIAFIAFVREKSNYVFLLSAFLIVSVAVNLFTFLIWQSFIRRWNRVSPSELLRQQNRFKKLVAEAGVWASRHRPRPAP